MGARIPKGMLLEGPPGVGKTLIAKAIAGEATCDFKYVNGSELEGMYKGEGAARVRKLFDGMRWDKVSRILFIDEFDSIAQKRGNAMNVSSGQLLNQLLVELDGFRQNSNIVVIASTNFVSKLDPAVLRPGRFDKIINIPLPAMQGRKEIIEYYVKKTQSELVEDKDFEIVARRTTGMTGSDIKNIVNIASLKAVKEDRVKTNMKDFDFALDRIRIGISNKTMDRTEKE